MFQEYYEYTENLLIAQYDVAGIISHPLVKGEVREHFLKEVIEKTFPDDIKLHRGLIAYDPTDQNQVDLFVKRFGAKTMNFGNHLSIHPEDCLLMIEVKSSATGTDLKNLNKRAKKLKLQCENKQPLCGLFSYKIDMLKSTVLNRFGYQLDEDGQVYIKSHQFSLEYPYIDFFICIDQESMDDPSGTNEIFLRKDSSLTSDGSYELSDQLPVIKDFLTMIQSILRVENINPIPLTNPSQRLNENKQTSEKRKSIFYKIFTYLLLD